MFILKTDYGDAIRTNILDDIVEADDTLIDKASKSSISLMKGYLNARYDTNAIFNATDDARHPNVLEFGVDIALYDLHRRINPRKVPAIRAERYKVAKEWLMDVSEGVINPPDLPLAANGAKDYINLGSNTKRDNYI